MKKSETPIVKALVLIGGGHSHVAVLKRFGMNPLPGVRLTLICRDAHTPYSGMLPGYVAGHYSYDEAHIDLGALARFAVVGAGAGGVEILLAIQHRLGQLRAGAGKPSDDIEFHLFSNTAEILPTHNARVRRTFLGVLKQRNVMLHLGEPVAEVAPGKLTTAAGTTTEADEILWVTAAGR